MGDSDQHWLVSMSITKKDIVSSRKRCLTQLFLHLVSNLSTQKKKHLVSEEHLVSVDRH